MATLGEIRHVAMYLRISQDKKLENFETLVNHRTLLESFACKNGFTFETYEEVLSGGSSELGKRPQLQRLLNEIETFDAILVVELSRLSRNGLISETVLQYCKDYDKPIITPEKVYDLANNDHDVLTFRFGALIASQEHALIGKRSKNNKIQMARAGLYISGSPPFGYVRNPKTKKLEIKEEEAETIRYIFTLHSQGLGSFKIRDILNAEGYKSATGKYFNLSSIKRIIKNPVYKGWTVFHDRKKVKKNGKFIYETLEKIVCKETHPAIIEEEIWDEINKDRNERAIKSTFFREKPANKMGVTLLKDLLYCSLCGKKMTTQKSNNGNMYTLKKCEYLNEKGKKCGNAGIKLEYVEKHVILHLQTFKEEIMEAIKALDEKKFATNDKDCIHRLNRIENKIKEVKDEKKNLIDLAVAGIFTHKEVREKKQELEDLLLYLQREHKNLKDEINDKKAKTSDAQICGVLSKMSLSNIKDHSDLLNETLKLVIKKIYYSRKMPTDVSNKSTRNPERRNYPFQLVIEYY